MKDPLYSRRKTWSYKVVDYTSLAVFVFLHKVLLYLGIYKMKFKKRHNELCNIAYFT